MLSIHTHQKLPLILLSAFCIFNFTESDFYAISLKANYPMPPMNQANYNPYPQQNNGGMPNQMMMQQPPMDQAQAANYQMQMQNNGMPPAPIMAPTMYPPYPPLQDPNSGYPPMDGGGMGMQDPNQQPQQPPFGTPSELDPNDPLQQALSLHQAARYADAIQIYESIIINNPPDPRIYASMADAHYRLGNVERALKYAVESLKLDPNYSSGHLLLGTILGEMGDMIRAIRAYEKVIALDQNNPYAYYNLGLLYYKKSDIRSALEYLERARDLNPNDASIWNNLGVAYYDNGQLAKASAAYSQALSLNPNYETASKNLELVRGKMPSSSLGIASAGRKSKKRIYSKNRSAKKHAKKKTVVRAAAKK